MQESATTKERSEFAIAGFDTIFQRWTGIQFFFFFTYSASLHWPWRKRKNLKKRLSEARAAKKSKSSDTDTAGSGSVDVDEELPQPKKKKRFLPQPPQKAIFLLHRASVHFCDGPEEVQGFALSFCCKRVTWRVDTDGDLSHAQPAFDE